MARHWLEVSNIDIKLKNLPPAFEGLRLAQLSDIHLGEFTEEFFLHHAVNTINALHPDVVLLTGDFITDGVLGKSYGTRQAQPCAQILHRLTCTQRFAVLGNHDVLVNPDEVTGALTDSGITVLRNSAVPLERANDRIWLAGLDDVLQGQPDLEATIPPSVLNQRNEPVLLMCHEPDFVRWVMKRPESAAIGLMMSGHTHGGQVRFPFVPPVSLPPLGRQYVEGLFRLGDLQLYVNRGLGTVGVPFRFNCPPELTLYTLRKA